METAPAAHPAAAVVEADHGTSAEAVEAAVVHQHRHRNQVRYRVRNVYPRVMSGLNAVILPAATNAVFLKNVK